MLLEYQCQLTDFALDKDQRNHGQRGIDWISGLALIGNMVAVAQSVRASGCGPEGRGFESHQPPQVTTGRTPAGIQFRWGFPVFRYLEAASLLNSLSCHLGNDVLTGLLS